MSEEKELSYGDSIKKASALLTRFPLIPVRGVPLMSHIAENFDSVWAFRPDPSDLLIATYPKAGTDNSIHLQLWGARLYSCIYIFHVFVIHFNKQNQAVKTTYISLNAYWQGIYSIQESTVYMIIK